jgi:hypothetical protein
MLHSNILAAMTAVTLLLKMLTASRPRSVPNVGQHKKPALRRRCSLHTVFAGVRTGRHLSKVGHSGITTARWRFTT